MIVDGIEINRVVELDEDGHHPGQAGQLAMRNGNAIAQAGGAQRLAVVESVEDVLCGIAGQRSDLAGQSFKHIALGFDVRANKHGLLGEDVGQFH